MRELERAIKRAGGLKKFADSLGVSPQVVFNWRKRRSIPVDRCAAIEKVTGGEVTREQLRPDIFTREARAA
jgi:DNA-binding transcriptional regulator YdaS (Cro superfamily)